MGPRSPHLETLRRTQTVRFGGLPVHDEHVPHRMHTPQRLRVELEQRISTHEETLEEAVRYAARRMNAGTM